MLTALQCRTARAALGLGVRELAELADVSPNTIARLERGEGLQRRTLLFLRGAIEAAGVQIIDDGATSFTGGVGVRLSDRRFQSDWSEIFCSIWAIPDLLRAEPSEKGNIPAYKALCSVLEKFLNLIEAEGREPDTWERFDLCLSLQALARRRLRLAFTHLNRAMTPPDNRSPRYPISPEDSSSTAGCDLKYFRQGCRLLRRS